MSGLVGVIASIKYFCSTFPLFSTASADLKSSVMGAPAAPAPLNSSGDLGTVSVCRWGQPRTSFLVDDKVQQLYEGLF